MFYCERLFLATLDVMIILVWLFSVDLNVIRSWLKSWHLKKKYETWEDYICWGYMLSYHEWITIKIWDVCAIVLSKYNEKEGNISYSLGQYKMDKRRWPKYKIWELKKERKPYIENRPEKLKNIMHQRLYIQFPVPIPFQLCNWWCENIKDHMQFEDCKRLYYGFIMFIIFVLFVRMCNLIYQLLVVVKLTMI